jgi:hypothetical protein
VQLVGADVARQPLGGVHPGLGDEDPLAVVLVHHPAPVAVDLVHLVAVPHRVVGAFAQLEDLLVDRVEVGQ